MTEIEQIDLFSKDLQRLKKKYRTLSADLDVFLKALKVNLPGGLPDTHRIPLGERNKDDPVFKVKSFRCRSLGGGSRSGIRLVYAYDERRDIVTLLEMYHKNEKEDHDEDRIFAFMNAKT
jgi:mRNA-degrading endonuclease RelE of RelBE toxin-antitoxin system